MNSFLKTGVLGLLAGALASLPLQSSAQTTNKAATDKKPATEKKSEKSETGGKSSRSIPFEGDVTKIDKVAKTIQVDKRTFEITSSTKIYKDDKPATLEQGVEGGYITGSYRKGEDGKLVARSIYFGGKGKGKSKSADKAADTKKAQ
jgi:hypothetical protein